MQIVLNGKASQIRDGIKLLDLLKTKRIDPDTVAIELNENVVERNDYGNAFLKEGDKIEIVRFMGGGRYER